MEATLLLSRHVEARAALREAENRDVGTMALCESRTPQRVGRLSSPCSGNLPTGRQACAVCSELQCSERKPPERKEDCRQRRVSGFRVKPAYRTGRPRM